MSEEQIVASIVGGYALIGAILANCLRKDSSPEDRIACLVLWIAPVLIVLVAAMTGVVLWLLGDRGVFHRWMKIGSVNKESKP